jgi:hypothetical protein
LLCDPTGRGTAPSDVDGDTVLYDFGEGVFQRWPTHGIDGAYDAVSDEDNRITAQGNRDVVTALLIGYSLEKGKAGPGWILRTDQGME